MHVPNGLFLLLQLVCGVHNHTGLVFPTPYGLCLATTVRYLTSHRTGLFLHQCLRTTAKHNTVCLYTLYFLPYGIYISRSHPTMYCTGFKLTPYGICYFRRSPSTFQLFSRVTTTNAPDLHMRDTGLPILALFPPVHAHAHTQLTGFPTFML